MHILGLPIDLVILDVDGVILDILGGLERNLERTASHFKLILEPIAVNLKEISLGKLRIRGNAWDSTRQLWPHLTDNEITEFVHHFHEIERTCPYAVIEGSLNVISTLRAHGIPVALATNNPMRNLLWRLEAAGIDPSWFVAIATKDDTYFKPHPKTFDTIFTRAQAEGARGVARERTLYVGDLQIDWDTARGAGVQFCAVLTGGVPREAFLDEGVHPAHIFNRLSDVLEYVEI